MNDSVQKIDLEGVSLDTTKLIKSISDLDKHTQEQVDSSNNIRRSIEQSLLNIHGELSKGNKNSQSFEEGLMGIETEIKKTNLRLDSLEAEIQGLRKESVSRLDSLVGQFDQMLDLLKMLVSNTSQ